MAAITMKNIVKTYGDGFQAVKGVSLDVSDGEFVILVGPSGCGKSTLVRMIVGLEDITSGDMIIGGKRVNDKAPRDRNLEQCPPPPLLKVPPARGRRIASRHRPRTISNRCNAAQRPAKANGSPSGRVM